MNNLNFDNIINIIKQTFPGTQKINGMLLKKWLNENQIYKCQLNNMLKVFVQLKSISQVIFCIRHNITYQDLLCKLCGNPIKVKQSITQRQTYCDKCKHIAGIQKRKSTIAKNQNYWKNRQKKIQQTNLKRYKTKTPSQNPQILAKLKQTCKNKDWTQRNNKSKNTCKEKYNVTNTFKIPQIAEKSRTTWLNRTFARVITYQNFQLLCTREEFTGTGKYYNWKCKRCQTTFNALLKRGTKFIPKCPICDSKNFSVSKSEKELVYFCKQYFSNLKENNKQLIKPYQLDIIIPQIKLAIEFNGIYWHSIDAGTPIRQHLNKTELCEAKGYRLIQIWQDDWYNNKEEIKNKLHNIFTNNEYIDISKPLDRCWYSTIQFQKYEIVQPEIIIHGKFKIENCGYLIIKN